MLWFSGFSILGEEYLFSSYLNPSAYCVAGFSYGSIKALEYVKEQIKQGKRVDTLQLLSPAFFQTKSDKFKRLQLLAYSKNRDSYLDNFLDACFYPHSKKSVGSKESTKEELSELLSYVWEIDELKFLADRGINIEVYLGQNDKIVDAKSAKDFFIEVATVTYIKDANHFLQID